MRSISAASPCFAAQIGNIIASNGFQSISSPDKSCSGLFEDLEPHQQLPKLGGDS